MVDWNDAGDEPGTTEKIERTDVGYTVRVSSTRGTGTRDQDKVTLEAQTEEYPDSSLLDRMHDDVSLVMEARREHQPDGDGE